MGHKYGREGGAQQADGADQRKRRSPAEELTGPGGERRAEQRGDGQAEHDAADRFGSPARPRHAGGDQRSDAKERAMRQAADETKADQHWKAGGEAAGDVAQPEDRHQQQQEITPREFGPEDRKDGRADHHAERIGADDVSRLRDGDAKTVGDARQEAHGGELAGADGETADGERGFGGAGAGK